MHINYRLSVTAKADFFFTTVNMSRRKEGETSFKKNRCFSLQQLIFGEKGIFIIQMRFYTST